MEGLSICRRFNGVEWYLGTPLQGARTLKAPPLVDTASNSVRLVEVARLYRMNMIGTLRCCQRAEGCLRADTCAHVQEGKVAVLVGTVTDDVRLFAVPKLQVACLRVTETARARILAVSALTALGLLCVQDGHTRELFACHSHEP